MLRLPREVLIAGPRNKRSNKHVKCVRDILTWIEKSIIMAITPEATECKRLPISHLRGRWRAVGRPRPTETGRMRQGSALILIDDDEGTVAR